VGDTMGAVDGGVGAAATARVATTPPEALGSRPGSQLRKRATREQVHGCPLNTRPSWLPCYGDVDGPTEHTTIVAAMAMLMAPLNTRPSWLPCYGDVDGPTERTTIVAALLWRC
jgi:hypothetical protein